MQCMKHKDELSMTNNRHLRCSPTLVIFVESKKGIMKRWTPHSQPIYFPVGAISKGSNAGAPHDALASAKAAKDTWQSIQFSLFYL